LRHVLFRSRLAHRRGQATVEAALTSMIVIFTIMFTLQMLLIAAQAFSAMYVAQTSARWLAVNIDATDTDLATRVGTVSAGLPGMGTGAPGSTTSGILQLTSSPACGSLTPPPPATGGKCALRNSGNPITVTVRTRLSIVTILPATLGFGSFVYRLPTSLPDISFTTMLE
jgi:hypothetical protein